MKRIVRYIVFILFLFSFKKNFSQQLYSFSTWTAGSTSYTKTVTAPNNTMTVTYSEGVNAKTNALCSGCDCFGTPSTAYGIPFYYNAATQYVADYSSSGCYGSQSGLTLAAKWANAVNANQWEQLDVVFTNAVCAPVTFNFYDINQNYWSGDNSKYFTDIVEVSALDNNSTSVPLANISIGNACGNILSSSGNTRIINGDFNDCAGLLNSVSIGTASTWVKTITIKYKRGLADYGPTAPFSQYIIVTNISGCNSNTVLPIELLSFSGKCNENNKSFSWSTATETNNDFFTVEKSKDGIEFEKMKDINGAGNSSTEKNYSAEFSDEDGFYYYRLKQTDFDGQYSYSNIIHINCFENYHDGVSLFPNPATDEISIHFESPIDTEIEYTITDVFGRTVKQETKAQSGNQFTLDTQQLLEGVYFFRFTEKQGINSFPVLRFIKQ